MDHQWSINYTDHTISPVTISYFDPGSLDYKDPNIPHKSCDFIRTISYGQLTKCNPNKNTVYCTSFNTITVSYFSRVYKNTDLQLFQIA